MMSARIPSRHAGPYLLLVASLMVGCAGDHRDSADHEPAAVRAQLVRAERMEVPQEVEIHGTVEADRTAAISARVMAMVSAVHVRAGERVRRGQLLLEIDPQTAKGQLAQAQGALAQARAALALAERNYERFQALAEVEAASELEADMARMQYEQAKGAVEQAEGAVAAASSVASDARVLAPFDGRVARKMVNVGDLATPGRPLMMIESVAGRQLALSVPESLMHEAVVRVGDRFRVRIDSRTDLGDLEGVVAETTPGADPATHSFQVKLDLPVSDITTGAAGRAWISARTRAAIVVPASAVLRQGGMTLVVIRTSEGLAGSRVVSVGRELPDDRIEILSGLNGGETVLAGLTIVPPTGAPVEGM